jgi:hypothetical protein
MSPYFFFAFSAFSLYFFYFIFPAKINLLTHSDDFRMTRPKLANFIFRIAVSFISGYTYKVFCVTFTKLFPHALFFRGENDIGCPRTRQGWKKKNGGFLSFFPVFFP